MQYARSCFAGSQFCPLVCIADESTLIAAAKHMHRAGLPHASVGDDEYKGYFIPKQSIILSNIWYVETWNLYHGHF
jgi:hypothetical protein